MKGGVKVSPKTKIQTILKDSISENKKSKKMSIFSLDKKPKNGNSEQNSIDLEQFLAMKDFDENCYTMPYGDSVYDPRGEPPVEKRKK